MEPLHIQGEESKNPAKLASRVGRGVFCFVAENGD